MATVSVRASDVADFDGWDSGFLGVDQIGLQDLVHDVVYGRSYWERAGSGRDRAREQGIDLAATEDLAAGAVGGIASVLGWGSPAQLKAGMAGVVGLLGMKGLKAADRSGDVWRASTLAQDVAKARKGAARNGLSGLDEAVLADGANQVVGRLGYQDSLLPGKWVTSNREMDLLPVNWLEQYAEFGRVGPRVDDLVGSLRARGLDEPLIMSISAEGRAVLLEGNHRLAAARQLGWDHLPVTVVTSKAGGVAPIELIAEVGAGKLVAPSAVAKVPKKNPLSGGFTWNPRTGNFDFTEGFPVGVSPLHTHRIPVEDFHARNALEFLNHRGFSSVPVARVLAEDPLKMIGGWVHDGHVYLDVTKVFDNVKEAKRVAARFGELAIYDLKSGKEIFIKGATKPSLVARAAYGGRTPPSPTDELRSLDYYFGDQIGSARMRPEMASVEFASLEKGQKAFITDELARSKDVYRFTPDDFNNKIVNDWLTLERERLLALSQADQSTLRSFTGSRKQMPRVSFFDLLDLERVPLGVGKQGAMYRKLTRSILDGKFDVVHRQLSSMANNLSKFVGKGPLEPSFYPYMAQMTLLNAKKTPAPMLAPMLGAASANAAPGAEAGRAFRAMQKVADNPEKYYRINNGVIEYIGPLTGYDNTVIRNMVDVANNPDWIMNSANGLSIKTYVYSLLKLNPRLGRALVVDTVDTQMRFGTKLGFSSDTTKAGEFSEMALNQYVTRAMASMVDAPVWAVQEVSWGLFRAVRDRFAGTPPSLTFSGRQIGEIYRDIGMPADIAQIAKRNYMNLVKDVRAGRAPHWQEIERNVLVPADNLPLELLLEPTFRANPGYADRFRAMVESAENLGEILRSGRGI